MKKYFYLIVLILLSCKKNSNYSITNLSNSSSEFAVFIIEDNSKNVLTSIFTNKNIYQNDSISHYITDAIKDTIKINLGTGQQIYLATKYNYRDTLFVSNGDTIVINLKKGSNSITKNNNFKTIIYRRNSKINILKNKYFFVSKEFPLEIEPTDFEKIKPIFPLKINFENIKTETDSINYIVSLIKNDLNAGFKFYDSISNLSPDKKHYLEQQKENLKLEYFSELTELYNFTKNENARKLINSKLFINDLLYKSNLASEFIYRFMNSVILENRKIHMGQKRITDYKQAMALLPIFFKGRNLQVAQIIAIKSAVDEEQNKKTIEEMINIYNSYKLNDDFDSLIFNIEKDYNLGTNNNATLNNVMLKTTNNENIIFENVVAKSSIDLVYIDFWASWCAPCRAAMPASKKLLKKYNGKVSFIYISVDKSFTAWQNANTKEDLGVKSSFITTNYPDATFFKQNQLTSIPRYMIYYKGKMVNSNAPSPESTEIQKEFAKYISIN